VYAREAVLSGPPVPRFRIEVFEDETGEYESRAWRIDESWSCGCRSLPSVEAAIEHARAAILTFMRGRFPMYSTRAAPSITSPKAHWSRLSPQVLIFLTT
jgi:hypothetical protein